MITPRQIEWAAGFLEGEGSFQTNNGATQVTAYQVQREPLDKLQRIFGGKVVLLKPPKNPRHASQHCWYLYSAKAAGVMMTIYSLMSPKRQEQIKRVLDDWKVRPRARQFRTHCPKGHPYDEHNTYRKPSRPTIRLCRICHLATKQEWSRKNKQKVR